MTVESQNLTRNFEQAEITPDSLLTCAPAEAELIEVHVPLQACYEGPSSPLTGADAHGLLLHSLGAVRPDAHDGTVRGFTASPLLIPDGGNPYQVRPAPASVVQMGATYRLRYTLLDADTVRAWHELAPHFPSSVRLGAESQRFERVGDLIVVRACRYVDLLSRPHPRWRLTFLTPTTFDPRIDGPARYVPLPDPKLITLNLAASWRRLAPTDAIRALAGLTPANALWPHLQIEAHAVHSVESWLPGARLPDGSRRLIHRVGFVGWVDLRYRSGFSATEDEGLVRLFAALVRLGTFAGVGEQRPRGMGILRATPL